MRQMLGDIASILRFHIILIAMTAALVFGWLFTEHYLWGIAVLGGLDWLLINLLNKVTDVEEDSVNEIRGTDRMVQHKRRFGQAWIAIQVMSLGLGLWWYPELTPYRLVVQLIGVGYSYSIVPTPKGLKRFKEIYFFKNFMSSVLFVLTVFIYPLVVSDTEVALAGGIWSVVVLAVFFVTFELTYEILYDLRDLEGDRLANVPTYPVVHGPTRSRQIIDGLLIGATGTLVVGLLANLIGLREGLMLLAPGIQFVWYRRRFERGLTSADCIVLTHMGTSLLVVFLIGTRVWLEVGLPGNVYLFG